MQMGMDIYEEDKALEAKIYLKLMDRHGYILPGLYDTMSMIYEIEAKKLTNYLLDRRSRTKEKCANCWFIGNKYGRETISGEYYDSPFDNSGKEEYFCSEECRDSYENEGDFHYELCDGCYRYVCIKNPRNGWHEHFRYVNDYSTHYCLRCYEEHLLENGISKEDLEEGKLPGMFFNYGNPELLEKGWKVVDGFNYYFINSQASANRICKAGISAIENGKKVIIAYERLGIGGSEGYVTLFEKES